MQQRLTFSLQNKVFTFNPNSILSRTREVICHSKQIRSLEWTLSGLNQIALKVLMLNLLLCALLDSLKDQSHWRVSQVLRLRWWASAGKTQVQGELQPW